MQIESDVEILQTESLTQTEQFLQDEKGNIDLLFLDLRMSDSHGLAGMMLLKASFPDLPIVIVSATDEVSTINAAIESGAVGYIVKSYSPDQIAAAYEDVSSGRMHMPESVQHAIRHSEQLSTTMGGFRQLTPTQLRVLVKMTNGLLNKQIAGDMGITEATVKSHVTEILKKLNCRNRTQAVLIAKELDIVLTDH